MGSSRGSRSSRSWVSIRPTSPLTLRAGAQPAIDVVIGHAGATEASMLQDFRRGRATEVDVINGAVVEGARAHDLLARPNTRVAAPIHGFERSDGEPSAGLLAQLAA